MGKHKSETIIVSDANARTKKKSKSASHLEEQNTELPCAAGPTKRAKGPQRKKASKRKRDAVEQEPESEAEVEAEAVPPAVEDVKPPNKKKKKSSKEEGGEKASEKEKSKKKKDKKLKGSVEEEEVVGSGFQSEVEAGKVGEEEKRKKRKKDKNNKKRKETVEEEVSGSGSESEADASKTGEGEEGKKKQRKKEKKEKKEKRKSKTEQGTVDAEASDSESEVESSKPGKKKRRKEKKDRKEKKEKRDKKDKKHRTANPEEVTAHAATNSSSKPAPHPAPPASTEDVKERWNVQELGGGAKRQDKFMRLLGGKKTGATAGGTRVSGVASSRPKLDINKASQELEQQFNAGVHMKFDASGKRKGLGA